MHHWTGPALISALLVWGLQDEGLIFAVVGGVCVLLAGIPLVLQRVARVPVGFAPGWIALLAVHVLPGMDWHWYERSQVFDKALHFGSFVWIGLVFLGELRRFERRHRVRVPGKDLWVVLCGLGIGAGWELFEFAVDHLGVVEAQHGLIDTMHDVLWDGVGLGLSVGLYALSARIHERRPHRDGDGPDV